MSRPKIIFTNRLSQRDLQKATIPSDQFVELIKAGNFPYLFCDFSPRHRDPSFLYIIKEGVFIINDKKDAEPLEEFFHVKKAGFEDFQEFLNAQRFNIPNSSDYIEFRESKFFGWQKKNYETFLDAKKRGFIERNEYEAAMNMGIENKQEYDDYREFKVYPYTEYLKAKKGGFKNKEEYEKAQKQGYDDAKAYRDFLQKRYIPFEKKINTIKKDCQQAFASSRWEEFIRLKYLLIEKLTELIFLKMNDLTYIKNQNELQINEILEEIEKKSSNQFINYDELNKWRIMRNNIVHEHLKIDSNTANEGKNFMNTLISKLEEIEQSS